MVAHVWAQQTQAEGWTSRKTFYFEGATIYSYGSHFPIARFVTNKKGQRAVLFTTRKYSNTTSKHIGMVHGALRGLDVPVFSVIDPTGADHALRKEYYQAGIAREFELAGRARSSKAYHWAQGAHLADEAQAYSKFFGQGWRIKVPVVTPEERAAAAELRQKEKWRTERARATRKQREAEMWEARRVAREKEAAEREVKQAALREAWLKGEPVTYFQSHGDTMLRVFNDSVQTSRGAEIPVDHALKLWPLILNYRAKGRAFEPNGHAVQLGHFTLDRIEANGDIKVGCHEIKFSEVNKIAQQLGLGGV
jgi:hypothetical protein